MKEQTFTVCVQVADQDADLLSKGYIEGAIRTRFEGSAVRVIECEPELPDGNPRYLGHVCDWQSDMDGSQFCTADEHPCENGFEMGPAYDPYHVACMLTQQEHRRHLDGSDRLPHEHSAHRGIHPLPGPGPEPQYVEWEGGGYCAGDPLPIVNIRHLSHDGQVRVD
jgi:hypothetical protein